MAAAEDEDLARSTSSSGASTPVRGDSGPLTARAGSGQSVEGPPPLQQPPQQQRDQHQHGDAGGGGSQRGTPDARPAQPEGGGGSAWGGLLGTGGLLPSLWEALVSQTSSPEPEEEEEEGSLETEEGAEERAAAAAPAAEPEPEPPAAALGNTAPPKRPDPGTQPAPELSEPSGLMDEDAVRALVSEVPARYRQSRWALLYSTQRDGISMQTMLRHAAGRSPTVLVVRDMERRARGGQPAALRVAQRSARLGWAGHEPQPARQGAGGLAVGSTAGGTDRRPSRSCLVPACRRAVFGAYCSEPWRQTSRYFGTGETFVFQLQPRQV